jgi:hypothetical protein
MNLKQFIFEQMDKNGYVTDQEIVNFSKDINSLLTSGVYQEEWRRYQRDKKFFADKEIISLFMNGNTRKIYAVSTNFGDYKCSRMFYEETRKLLGYKKINEII